MMLKSLASVPLDIAWNCLMICRKRNRFIFRLIGLNLSYLNPLVDAPERGGEVLDGDVHVLQLLAELLPLVVAEGCQVKVDQLGREPRELVIEADAVVAALRHVALLIL